MLKKIISLLLLITLLLTGCSEQKMVSPDAVSPQTDNQPKPLPTDDTSAVLPPPHEPSKVDGELTALAETLKEAQDIAALYDIELLSFENGVALFYTDKNTAELIACGIQNGWPELSENHIYYTNQHIE